jgi:phosphoglycolate phosphatase
VGAGVLLLFDLDGTLTDSRRGIVACIRHALEQLECEAPPDHDLTRYVGPPLAASFEALLATSDPLLVDRAIAAYRERYERVGFLENDVYPGIREALVELGTGGHALRVVTAKPRTSAARIVSHFGLADLFQGVHGPELTQRHYTKGFLIEEALAASNRARGDAWMIGDRPDDIQGAREAGVRAIAVTWGYGTRDELERARPDLVVDSPAALMAHVVRSAVR